MPHLVEAAIGAVLDELKSNVGLIANSWESQGTNVDRHTPLGALPLKVRNGKLITTVGGVEIIKRVRVGDGRDLDSD